MIDKRESLSCTSPNVDKVWNEPENQQQVESLTTNFYDDPLFIAEKSFKAGWAKCLENVPQSVEEKEKRKLWLYGNLAFPNREAFKYVGIPEAFDYAVQVEFATPTSALMPHLGVSVIPENESPEPAIADWKAECFHLERSFDEVRKAYEERIRELEHKVDRLREALEKFAGRPLPECPPCGSYDSILFREVLGADIMECQRCGEHFTHRSRRSARRIPVTDVTEDGATLIPHEE